MNQFFSLKRFILLVLKHWADNKKRYILSVLAFIGLLITWFVFVLVVDDGRPMDYEIQVITYFFSLFAVGTFYASQYFRDLGSRAKGINFLLVPASLFEKLLCSLLYTVIFFLIIFSTAFYLVDFLMVAISNTFIGNKAAVANVFDIVFLRFNSDSTITLLFIFFSIQSAFLLGSVYFKKYGFIKTIISGFVAVFLLVCLVFFLYDFLLPKGEYQSGFLTSYRVRIDGVNDRLVEVPRWIGKVCSFIVMYAIAPFLWIVSYYRLREKQV
ncbi:MAG: hypothetical protein ABI480_07260 [Chitinophagaceae bacterium]